MDAFDLADTFHIVAYTSTALASWVAYSMA